MIKQTLIFRIDHDKPLDLKLFLDGLDGICRMHNARMENKADTRLSIHEIKKGSIITELVSEAQVLYDSVHPISMVIFTFGQIIQHLKTPDKVPLPENTHIEDIKNTVKAIKPSNQKGIKPQYRLEIMQLLLITTIIVLLSIIIIQCTIHKQ